MNLIKYLKVQAVSFFAIFSLLTGIMGFSWLLMGQSASAAPAPVAAFSFNETSGTTAANIGNPSVNGVVSGATWTTAGKNGGALSFDGVNDKVNVADYAAIDLTNRMSLSAWLRPTSLANWRTVILKERPSGLSYSLYAANGANQPPSMYSYIGGDRSAVASSALPLNTWSHLTGTYDGTTMRLYVNGVQVATRSQTGNMTTSNNPLSIGGNNIWSEWFAGQIDDVRVYNVALTPAEVTADMNTPVQPSGPDEQAPSVPANLSGSAISGNQINLTWTASTDNVGVTGYQIWRGGAQIGTSTSPNFGDATVTPGNSYTYTVRAYDAAGNVSADSNTVNVSTPAPDTTAPSDPTNLAANPISGNQVNLTWTASTDNVGVTGYQIWRGGAQIGTSTSPSFGDGTVTPGNTYTYTVRAYDAAGNVSADSNTANATTPAPDTTPPMISSVNASGITQTAATISWTTDELSDTQVEYGLTTSYGNSTTLNSSLVTSHSQNLSGLSAGTTYNYRVKSKDSSGNLAMSANNTFTTVTPPADSTPPTTSITSPAIGATVSGTINVNANASDNVGVVGVQFKLDGVNLSAEDTTNPYSVSWNTTTATNGSHQLSSVARDAAGNTTTSAIVNVTVSNGGGGGTALSINGSQRFQTMDGFGTSILATDTTATVADKKIAIDKLAAGGTTIWRVIAENTDWESTNDDSNPFSDLNSSTYFNNLYGNTAKFQHLWEIIRYLNQKDAADPNTEYTVMLSFMGIGPSWMMDPGKPEPHWLRTNDPVYEDEWVETVLSAIRYGVKVENVKIDMFAPNNEMDWHIIEGIRMEDSLYVKLLNRLSLKMDDYAMNNIELVGPDYVGSCANGFIDKMKTYPSLMTKIKHITIHSYNGDACNTQTYLNGDPATADKNFWMSEFGKLEDGMTNIGQTASSLLPWDGYDAIYQHAILNGNGSQPGNDAGNSPALLAYNATTKLYTERKEYYQFAQLFKYVPRGSQRIAATQNASNVKVYAFHDPVSNRQTIVGQNLSSSSVTYSGTLANTPTVPAFEYYVTDASVNLQRGSDVAVNSNAFSVVVPRSSVFTLTYAPPADQIPPSAPTNLNATGRIGAADLTWTASTDNVGVSAYDVHRSTTSSFTPAVGNKVGETAATSYTDSTAAGTYYYKVVARDAGNNFSPASNQASATITLDTVAPTVSVTSPTNGSTVAGTINLTANASDNVSVIGVKFYIDGVQVGIEDTTSPYSVAWNSYGVTNGTHNVTAEARDAAGNTTLSSAVSFTVNNILSPNLIAAYNFNEGSGATTGDLAGGDNGGTISGATWTTAGKYGSALSFDGVNDWVTIPDADNLDLTNGMTLEAWVKPNALNGWSTVVLKENNNLLAYALYGSVSSNQPPAGYIRIGGDIAARGPSVLPLGVWSHIATTYNGNVLNLYVNGNLVTSTNVTGNISVSNGVVRIGGNNVWSEWFNGSIDEVQIYNVARSQAEIQSDMNNPL